MAIVMRGRGWMDRDEVARQVAAQGLYLRPKDGEPPPSYQIGMRARKYPHWFESRGPGGGQIRLIPSGPGQSVATPRGRDVVTPAPSRPLAANQDRSRSGDEKHLSDDGSASARRAGAADRYRPERIETLLIAEAPPSALDRYFYFPDVEAHDSLFRHVAAAILGETPSRDGMETALSALCARGFFLIDVSPEPLGAAPLEAHVPALVERVRHLAPEKVILIKATVYDAAFTALAAAGLPVVDERIPFPGSGQQRRFAVAFDRALQAVPGARG
jgi:hypothetical protein